LIIKGGDNWTLPGGKSESKETPIETLKRELWEEARVTINENEPLGYCKVNFPNNPNKLEGELFYQVRFFALIKKVEEIGIDPATGILFKRKFIKPEEFNKFIKWGKIGEEMLKLAKRKFNELKQSSQN